MPKKIIILVNPAKPRQVAAARAVAAGCLRHGDRAKIAALKRGVRYAPKNPEDTSVFLCCWGWHYGKPYHKMGGNVLIMECAYIGDRYEWVSLGWNGLNRRALFPRVEDKGARWRQFFKPLMRPWRTNPNGYALLMGQVPTDKAVDMIDFENWAQVTAAELKRYGHDVRFRPHPLAPPIRNPAPVIKGTLESALAGAAFAITWNSNSGVDAVMSGLPAVTMDKGAMAWEVTSHKLTAPIVTPDRESWGRRMAYTQWLPTEIESGDAWEHLRNLV